MSSERGQVPEHLRVRRQPTRGAYDRATIDAILDEALFCHLGFVDDGRPFVIPTLHARVGDRVYVHGSAASRMLRAVARGVQVCVARRPRARQVRVQPLDQLPLGRRDGDRHAGRGRREGRRAACVRRAHRAGAEEARRPNAKELRATSILALPLDESSAKVRAGGPEDDPEDEDLDVWAGVVPVHLTAVPSDYAWARVKDGRLGPR